MTFDQTLVMQYLKKKDPSLFACACQLRKTAQAWLGYIPATFPNYTTHAVEHSDEMLAWLPCMLFRTDKPSSITITLNGTETFVLVAADYLHDAGMVVSQQEIQELLASPEWNEWVSSDAVSDRHHLIDKIREDKSIKSASLRQFLSDVQLRYLVADFIRQRHHERVPAMLDSDAATWSSVLLNDSALVRAVGDVCRAHGLRPFELEDPERYPDTRDIRGEPVNLRLLAILLRLADLLDLRTARACPWLVNAACPMPPDSLPHWKAGERIIHQAVTPDKICVTAECESHDEHRVLKDWCQWLVEEIADARSLVAVMSRHDKWKPPVASVDGRSPTLTIRPSKRASYRFREWRLEVDRDLVVRLLTRDLWGSTTAFVRELIQNALDATRTQMYLDLKAKGLTTPAWPTDVGEEIRGGYKVRVYLQERNVVDAAGGTPVRRQFLTVEDCGVGMDEHVITNYFLQVGRSYYTTEEYRRTCAFTPTSRFGIGFLSVFGVSDHVTVETYKPSSDRHDGPLLLTLTGPRNYLLVETGTRATPGTKVEVRLRESLSPGEVTEFVRKTCPRAEFSIEVDDLGQHTTVSTETASDFVTRQPVLGCRDATMEVRSFPVRLADSQGELYVFIYRDKTGEDWTKFRWATEDYVKSAPGRSVPRVPGNLVCFHGCHLYAYDRGGTFAARLDVRAGPLEPQLSRESVRRRGEGLYTPSELPEQWTRLCKRHLSSSAHAHGIKGWRYRLKLASVAEGCSPGYWESMKETTLTYRYGKPKLLSWKQVMAASRIAICSARHFGRKPGEPLALDAEVYLPRDTLGSIPRRWLDELIRAYTPGAVNHAKNHVVTVMLTPRPNAPQSGDDRPGFTDLPWPGMGFDMDHEFLGQWTALKIPVLNRQHPLVQWFSELRAFSTREDAAVRKEDVDHLTSTLFTAVRYGSSFVEELNKPVSAWRRYRGLPVEFIPPNVRIDANDVCLPSYYSPRHLAMLRARRRPHGRR